MTGSTSQTTTVDYATSDGTAIAGLDYTAVSGTLTFAAGETSKDIEVIATVDNLIEGEENFNVTLSNPTNASITDNTAVATILLETVSLGGNDPHYYPYGSGTLTGNLSGGTVSHSYPILLEGINTGNFVNVGGFSGSDGNDIVTITNNANIGVWDKPLPQVSTIDLGAGADELHFTGGITPPLPDFIIAAEKVFGSTQDDTLTLTFFGGQIDSINLGDGNDSLTIVAGHDGATTSFSEIENISYTSSGLNTTLTLTGTLDSAELLTFHPSVSLVLQGSNNNFTAINWSNITSGDSADTITIGDHWRTGPGTPTVLNTGGGNDVITISSLANDTYNAGAGNDTIKLTSLTITDYPPSRTIDGEDGIDILQYGSAGLSLNLATGLTTILNMEQIDLNAGSGSDSLTINLGAVQNMSEATNSLTSRTNSLLISGDANDSVTVVRAPFYDSALADWATNGTSTISGEVYTVYEHNSADAAMLIDVDISVA